MRRGKEYSFILGLLPHPFKDRGTEDIFNGRNTNAARKVCPSHLWRIAARKVDQLILPCLRKSHGVEAPGKIRLIKSCQWAGLIRIWIVILFQGIQIFVAQKEV